MIWLRILVLTGLALLLDVGLLTAESGRIYGKLYTADNEVFEGWIRWDKNEAFWDDPIDGTCDRKSEKPTASKTSNRHYKERKSRSITIFGLRFGDEGSIIDLIGNSSCQLPFGHIKTLLCDSDDPTVILKSGREVVFTGGLDLGGSVREILLTDIKEGDIYFDWEDLDKIEFMKETKEPDDGLERLYGRVSTRRAGEFTGWIEWDVDEVFNKDVIDGEENGGRSRKLAFERIASIERRSSASATVTLKDGKSLDLENTNDVNSENRGIAVISPQFGQVKIDWSDFEKAEFQSVPKNQLPRYQDFDGGTPLHGTVTTEDGQTYTGHIIWDNDEEYSWEYLNGEYKGIKMDIPFSVISAIEKSSDQGADVTLKDGDTYLLRGSNDVDDSNRGILIVQDNGKVEEIDWSDFAKLVIK
jgi:hypothetical protein